VFFDRRGAFLGQGADGGGGGIEFGTRYFSVMAQNRSKARIVGHPFKHDAGQTVDQRSVDDVAVAGDPADVGRAPETSSSFKIEDSRVVMAA
jgi:hypothetical protein